MLNLLSVVPVKRSHSGLRARRNQRRGQYQGRRRFPAKHFDDTVYGGDFFGESAARAKNVRMAPSIIYLFDRMGVPFFAHQRRFD
jgi:succinate dehydrogenase / fumarate reductase flavoprotein subunit